MYSLARLRERNETILRAVVAQSRWIVRGSSTQSLANICWGLAKLDVDRELARPFLSEVDRHAEDIMRRGTPESLSNPQRLAQSVANISWAMARIGVRSPGVFEAISKRADWLVDNGSPQAINNIIWAFATSKVIGRRMFTAVEERACYLVDNALVAQDVSGLAWAFGKMQCEAPALCVAVDWRSDLVVKGGTQEIANTAFAFAKLGYRPERFFDLLEKDLENFVRHANPQEVR